MKTRYEVVDSDFNKANYPDLIGKKLDNPPGYANVRMIQEKTPMKEIWHFQSKSFSEPTAETSLEDFAIKCIREGYDKEEVIKGLTEFYRQDAVVGREIVDRSILNYLGINKKKASAFLDAIKKSEAVSKNQLVEALKKDIQK